MLLMFLSVVGCQTDAEKAEELLIKELEEQLKRAAPCLEASGQSSAPKRLSTKIVQCIEAKHNDPYVMSIEIEERSPQLILANNLGPQPTLHSQIEKECIKKIIEDWETATIVPKLDPMMYPAHSITLARESSGKRTVETRSFCRPENNIRRDSAVLPLIEEFIVESNQPWETQKIGAQLLSCDRTFLPPDTMTPILLSLHLSLPTDPEKRGTCQTEASEANKEYQSCVCNAVLDLQQRRPQTDDLSITITSKNKETRRYFSQPVAHERAQIQQHQLFIYRKVNTKVRYRYMWLPK